jgi:hypothetical protein
MRGIDTPTARKPHPASGVTAALRANFIRRGPEVPVAAHRTSVTRKPETKHVFAVEYCWFRDDPDELFLVSGYDGNSLMSFLAKAASPGPITGSFKDLMSTLCVAVASELRARWERQQGRSYPVEQLVFETLRDVPTTPGDCPGIFVVEDLSDSGEFDVFKKAANRDRSLVLLNPSTPGFVLKILRREQLLQVTRL